MRKPNESLDDFVVKAEDIKTEPPQAVSLRLTGEVEVLKPLAVPDFKAKREAVADIAPLGLSWFHRSLVAGGAFALGAVILASAIFIGMSEADELIEASGVAGVSEVPVGVSEVPEVSGVAGVSELSDSEIRNPHSEIRNQRDSAFRPRKLRRQPLRPRYVVSNFTPTTLVIFIEKGEIKTRIEPQITNYKKPLTFSN